MSDDAINLSPEANRVIELLRAAGERCRDVILDPPGASESSRAFAQSRAASQLAQINKQLDRLNAQIVKISGQAIEASYREGLALADKQAKDAGIAPDNSPVKGSFSLVDIRRAEVLSRETSGNLTKAIESMRRVTNQTVRKIQAIGLDDDDINKIIAGGTIDGQSKATLAALRATVRKVADGKMIETVNKTTGAVTSHKPDDYADMVMQTKTREATRVATADRLREKKIDLVKIIGSHSANFCTLFVDKVYSLNGDDETYPALSSLPNGGPPFHPRCSKQIVAFIPLLASKSQLDKAKPDDATNELLGTDSSAAQKLFRSRKSA